MDDSDERGDSFVQKMNEKETNRHWSITMSDQISSVLAMNKFYHLFVKIKNKDTMT